MHKIFRAAAPLIVAGSLLGGCASTAPTERLPQMTFSHLEALQLNVAKVEIENRFAPPLKAPHIEHQMPVSPAGALEQWLKDRVKAVGATGTARLIIDNARATGTPLARDESLKGKFTKQQAQRYDMAVQATLEVKSAAGIVLASASANAKRSITAREDISLNDREKLWFETLSQLMKDFNAAMDANVRRFMGGWLQS